MTAPYNTMYAYQWYYMYVLPMQKIVHGSTLRDYHRTHTYIYCKRGVMLRHFAYSMKMHGHKPLCPDCINLINEHNGWSMIFSNSEQLSHQFRAFTLILKQQITTVAVVSKDMAGKC